jgi:hypothetical protein
MGWLGPGGNFLILTIMDSYVESKFLLVLYEHQWLQLSLIVWSQKTQLPGQSSQRKFVVAKISIFLKVTDKAPSDLIAKFVRKDKASRVNKIMELAIVK